MIGNNPDFIHVKTDVARPSAAELKITNEFSSINSLYILLPGKTKP